MKQLTYQGMTLTLDEARENLADFQKLQYDLARKLVRPVDIVGKGYKDTRETAVAYVAEAVGRYQTMVTIMEEN